MSPLLAQALGSLIRHALTYLAGLLVARGLWTQDEAASYVGAAVAALLALGWSLWSKYKGRLRFLTALQLPQGSTEADVKDAVR